MRLDPQGSLPLILCQSDRGENFVLYEDNSMVIFACDRNLSVSNQCEHWFMDGTFSICPKDYYQLFTVHGMFSDQIVLLVYGLFIGKDTNDYDNFFQQLLLKYDYEPEPILVDFESATLKSTKSIFPDAIQIGCLFHFGQCLWRENEREKLMALAFVPVADVIKAYSCLINDFDDDDNPLLDYFERVWVGQKKGRGSRRSKPKFSLPVIRFEV
ncbi:unnamed protein product [Rotaria magnacalcarata]|uniref:MULE transposase domain-containing protein n=1 Tax=Rotaria magnacalcarata TaxID=392030 RepID=A0A819K554_9BILA|nr:unnamed protein product [Rotaria magnacalcarata]CAF3941247.1 unnamed protein product [Rotaria magnacalcarata]